MYVKVRRPSPPKKKKPSFAPDSNHHEVVVAMDALQRTKRIPSTRNGHRLQKPPLQDQTSSDLGDSNSPKTTRKTIKRKLQKNNKSATTAFFECTFFGLKTRPTFASFL